jgi:hypothetical protein
MGRKPLPDHVWACPQCFVGWQQYMINQDLNICSHCGYKGGDVDLALIARHYKELDNGAPA